MSHSDTKKCSLVCSVKGNAIDFYSDVSDLHKRSICNVIISFPGSVVDFIFNPVTNMERFIV